MKNSKFKKENIKNIFFLGYSPVIKELSNINQKLKIKTFIACAEEYKKFIDKNLNFKVFFKLDNKFKKFVNSKVSISETLFISLNSRWIFNQNMINFLQGNLLNFHSTRLPFDRGGAYYSWIILKNDRINNQVLHFIDENIDTGKIIFNLNEIVPRNIKIPIDYEKFDLQQLIKAYSIFINKINRKESFNLIDQPNYIGSYHPRLSSKFNGWINWDYKSLFLERYICAFDQPYEGAKTFINNNEVKIQDVQLHSGELPNHPFMTGLILRKDKNWLVVATCDENCILISKVLDKNGRNIIAKLKEGDRFYTPIKFIENSKIFRAKYNHKGLKKNV